MSARLIALAVDAVDPQRLATFWAGLLGWDCVDDFDGGLALSPSDDTGFRLRFVSSDEPKQSQNRMHFDLTSASVPDQQQTVELALSLGAEHADVGQRGDEGHVVLADPEGNEFCVIEPGNAFLAECGFVGALACDGTRAVGRFWSDVLGWPLVWDQGEETAIRSQHGGPKITWGGPPLMPRDRRDRLHFDLAPGPGEDHDAEVARLVSLGASPLRVGEGAWDVLADPDANEFFVWRER